MLAKNIEVGDYLPDYKATVEDVSHTNTIRNRVILTLTNDDGLVFHANDEVKVEGGDCLCHKETGSHEACCGNDGGRNPDCPQHGDGSTTRV